jgi:hypothetical protein
MNKIGEYKIETSFNITGRGIVALCQKINGTIRIGAVTNIIFKEKVLCAQIIGYEQGNFDKDELMRYGLNLKFDDTSYINEIISEKLKEQYIEVFE